VDAQARVAAEKSDKTVVAVTAKIKKNILRFNVILALSYL